MGTKYTDETPVTPELVVGALVVEVSAMRDELEAGREISPDRMRRARHYLDALGIELEA